MRGPDTLQRGPTWALVSVLAFATALAVVIGVPVPAVAVVPAPSGSSSVITVRTGADRDAATVATALPGVVLQLSDATTGVAVDQPWARCTSDAGGDCSFTVPATAPGAENYDRRFTVSEVAAPSGFAPNPSLTLGALTGPFASTSYRFTTPAMRPGQTYASGTAFMNGNAGRAAAQYQASTGVWQDSRTNPVPEGVCGLDVALILDFSASVTATQFVQLKQAAQTLVSSLQGTPSSVAVFTFGTGATENIPATPVATAAQASAVNARIGALTQPPGQFTNWDAAFNAVATSGQHFDQAIMVTDGNPTLSGTETTNGSTRFSAIEDGIFSANAVKAQGTRIVAMGVGAGTSASGDNLAAISGPTAGLDYFQTADYTAAAAQLKTLAQGDCIPSLTIVKEIIPNGGTAADATPDGGWTFDVAPSAGVTAQGSPGTTADGTGAVNFPLGFPTPTTTTQVAVTELPTGAQSGYTFLPAGTACRDIATGADVPTTPAPDGPGFTLSMSAGQGVSCVVLNQAPPPVVSATVRVDKVWDVNGRTYADGQQPVGIGAALSLDAAAADFGTVYGGYQEGQTVVIDEDPTITLPLCRITGTSLEVDGTPHALGPTALAAGDNTAVLTNTVVCESRLSLVKTVQGGGAAATDWTLSATPLTGGALDGPSGATGTPAATAAVSPGVTYALAESGGDPRYAPLDYRDPTRATAGSTGSWTCSPRSADGGSLIGTDDDGTNGGIRVALGEWVQCVVTNQTATLTLVKVVDGGTATPADWRLTASPIGGPANLAPETVTGSASGAAVLVRPGTEYRLTESGPDGYHLGSLQCAAGDGGGFTASDTVSVAALGDATCRYTNVVDPSNAPTPPAPAPPTPTPTPPAPPVGGGEPPLPAPGDGIFAGGWDGGPLAFTGGAAGLPITAGAALILAGLASVMIAGRQARRRGGRTERRALPGRR